MAVPMADNTLYPVPPVAPDYAPPTVTVEPDHSYVATNQTTQFTASVADAAGDEIADAADELVWSVNGVRGGDPATGQISDDGTFLAPFHTPNPSAYEIGCRYRGAVGRATVTIVARESDIPTSAGDASPASTTSTGGTSAGAAASGTPTAGGNP